MHRLFLGTDIRLRSNTCVGKMSQKSQLGRSSQGGSESRRSQGGPVRSSQGAGAVDARDVIAAAEKAVHFIIAHAGAHNAPIKHTDLKKCVFQDMRVEEPLRVARKMLNDAFGYDVQEVPGKTKTYIVVNKLRNRDHIFLPKSAEAYRTLLSLVLGYIFMSRQEVEEKNLKKFLQQMGIDPVGFHPYFGDVNDFLFKSHPTYVRDQYLHINSNEQGNFYDWGERATREVDRRSVLKFVCEILGSDPKDWQLHLKDCEDDEDMDTDD